jgi:hypothetical protein
MSYRTHAKNGATGLLTCFAMLVCAGCTPLFSRNPDQWRDGRVAGIVHRDAIPADIDHHCIGPPDDDTAAAGKERFAIIAIHLGRRMASYRLAMPISDGKPLIHVGDQVIVQPQPCRLELPGIQAE